MRGSTVRPDGEVRDHKHKGSNPHEQHAPTKPAGFAGPYSTTQVCDGNQTGERCNVVPSGYQAGLRGPESEPAFYGCDDYVDKPVHHHSCNESTFYIKFQQSKKIQTANGEICIKVPVPTYWSWNFCYRLRQPQGHSATGRIMSLKNSSDTIVNRTRDLPVCSVVP